MSNVEAKSEISGRVFQIAAEPGQRVEEGDAVVILEAMKMEIAVEAPKAGVVKEIRVAVEQPVEEGDVIAIIETA
ncbi:acetyl-CoA carboxylase biotin carboxyl carrier protein subunit [Camelimonas lactis]|uniref:Biotin-dependent enzyme n=1 Tax=Camelimonas lactis TaxID=659006 RepID=A0A4R2GS20_9HYPH|nr:acetyl-CoA carboxylase biotin carboxyl carrier protein subunit [Camelimonas lactis]TCO13021.1 biotin-dependent enzyme [Camelimonas lactis]